MLDNSKNFDMTLREHEKFITQELQVDALDTVYSSPKIIFKDGNMKILKKIKNFF